MLIEFQEYASPSEEPDVGDVLNLHNYPSKAVLVAHTAHGFVLIDLYDGYQMWAERDTISELMNQVDDSWTIMKNSKLIVG